MPYRALKDYYCEEEVSYLQEYERRFSSEDAVHIGFQIGEYQAFFVENTAVLRLNLEIARLDKQVMELSMKLPGVAKKQYSMKCLIDEIMLTNRIEGVHSSRREIGDVLEILDRQSAEREEHPRFLSLVNKYLKLMTQESVPLNTCEDIREIYNDLLLDEVIEENPNSAPDGILFRKESTMIYNETGDCIHQGLSPEGEIMKAMGNALRFLNDTTVEPIYRVCLFHYLLEYIHPFYDGNGRLGRFILSYCITETLEPLLAYRISETIKENRKEYYEAFEICNERLNRGELTPFLLMQMEMIRKAFQDLKRSLERRLMLWDKYERLVPGLPGVYASTNQEMLYSLLIQAALFSESGISTRELMQQFELTYNPVKRLLDQVPKEMLHIQKKGRAKYYQMDLAVLDNILLEQAANEEHAQAELPTV